MTRGNDKNIHLKGIQKFFVKVQAFHLFLHPSRFKKEEDGICHPLLSLLHKASAFTSPR